MARLSLSPFTHTFTAEPGIELADLKDALSRKGIAVTETASGFAFTAKQKELLGFLYRGKVDVSVTGIDGGYRFTIRFPSYRYTFLIFAALLSVFVLTAVAREIDGRALLSVALIWGGSYLAFWGHLTPRVAKLREFLVAPKQRSDSGE